MPLIRPLDLDVSSRDAGRAVCGGSSRLWRAPADVEIFLTELRRRLAAKQEAFAFALRRARCCCLPPGAPRAVLPLRAAAASLLVSARCFSYLGRRAADRSRRAGSRSSQRARSLLRVETMVTATATPTTARAAMPQGHAGRDSHGSARCGPPSRATD
jgi:hypothetical protein